MCKKLFRSADCYLKTATWKDMALLKFCLFAMGVLVGCGVKQERRKPVRRIALLTFVATYIPLMAGYLPCLKKTLDCPCACGGKTET